MLRLRVAFVYPRPSALAEITNVQKTFVYVKYSEVLLKVLEEFACIQRAHYEAARAIGLGIKELNLRVRHVVAIAHYLSNKGIAHVDTVFFLDGLHDLVCLPNAFLFLTSNGV